jgi:site-specific DNA-methyltransferase (adenine-specific)
VRYDLELKEINKESYYHDKTGMLLEGDCIDWMTKLPDQSIDLILCDLPYGTTAAPWDSIIPFDLLWNQYERIIKDNGNIILTASQPFTSALIMSNPKLFRYEIIWEKERPTNIFTMKNQIGKVHENVLVFYKKQGIYNPIMEERIGSKIPKGYDLTKLNNNGTEIYNNTTYKYSENYDCTKKYPRSVMYFVRDKKGIHPTQKPVAMFEYLINTFSNENAIVLDNASGSGTTAIACKNTNRRWICIEKENKYCVSSTERINSHTTP